MVWYLSRGDLDPPLGWWSFGNDQGRGTMTPPMVDGPVTAAETHSRGGCFKIIYSQALGLLVLVVVVLVVVVRRPKVRPARPR